jgi:3-oxoacyl-[acyl-carrier protein] reductase
MRLKDKVSLVTGSSRGIGRSIALALAREGSAVAVNYSTSSEAAGEVAEEIRKLGQKAIVVKADVAVKSDVDAMFKKVIDEFGKIDILVNNAGMSVVGASEELEEKRWRRGIDVMLTGAFFCSQAAGKEMIKRGGGKIINIASVNGILAFPERVSYSCAKAGLMQLTKVLGCEWARHNINVNAVAAGYVKTNLVEDLAEKGTLDVKEISSRTPLGRLAEPEEIADAVIFLASNDSKYMEGQTLVIDGGWSAYGYLESWLAKSRRTEND